MPEFDAVIRRARRALAPGRRLAIFDFKEPDGWPEWAIRLAVWVGSPFGITRDLADRHPWESVARHFPVHAIDEVYGGLAYVAVGERRERATERSAVEAAKRPAGERIEGGNDAS